MIKNAARNLFKEMLRTVFVHIAETSNWQILIKTVVVVVDWLFNVTINDISVIYVTAHRCAGGLKKK